MRGADFLFGYKCNQKGCCCRTWKIGLREADYHRMRRAALGTELEDDMAAGLQVRRPGPFAHLVPAAAQHQRFDSNFGAIAKEPDGSCTFLATDDLCRVHGVLGEAALPQICSNFPIGGMDTRDGPLSFWDFTCPEVVATLASATAPARVIEAPEAFTRETTVFRPVDGLARVALTSNSDVPWELVSAWHEDLWEAARTNAQQPLAVLGRAAWYAHAWATSGVSPGRFAIYTGRGHIRKVGSLSQSTQGAPSRGAHMRSRHTHAAAPERLPDMAGTSCTTWSSARGPRCNRHTLVSAARCRNVVTA